MLSQLAVISGLSTSLPWSISPGFTADLADELGETLYKGVSVSNPRRPDCSCVPPGISPAITPVPPHVIRWFPIHKFTLEKLVKPGPPTGSLNASGQGVFAAERIAVEWPDREIARESITLNDCKCHVRSFPFEKIFPVQKEADA